jgi:hypothetical protein
LFAGALTTAVGRPTVCRFINSALDERALSPWLSATRDFRVEEPEIGDSSRDLQSD